jgi:hypothetical protein
LARNSGIYDIREDEVSLKGKSWDDDGIRTLWARKMLEFHRRVDYAKWLLSRGRMLMDYYQGKILPDDLREYYQDIEDKVVIEPRLMKTPIRALVGQVIRGRRSGSFTSEGGTVGYEAASADEIDVINLAMKWVEKQTKEHYKVRDAVHDSCVSCYPNVLYWDMANPEDRDNVNGYKLVNLPWDACAFGPVKFRAPDGSDIRDMLFFDYFSEGELLDIYPRMKKQILDHFDDASDKKKDFSLLTSLNEWDETITSESRDVLYDLVSVGCDMVQGKGGLVPTVMHLFPIRREEEVWVDMNDESMDSYRVRPPKWSDNKWEEWLRDNPSYDGPFQRPVVTLWQTVFTTTGLVLSNEAHWFQEYGRLPCSFWIPAMISGVPSGPADDMKDDTLAKCIGEIEYLDELRKNSARLLRIREGAIANVDELSSEASKNLGAVFIKQDFQGSNSDAVDEMIRSPNPAFKNWADQRQAEMYNLTALNETMQGDSSPRQSDVAKQTEIAMALIVNAIYIDNFNLAWENHQQLKALMIPYIFNDYFIAQIVDEETGDEKELVLNEPVEFDDDGNATSVINDVAKRRYTFRLSPVDDSPTARQQQMSQAMNVINATAGPLTAIDKTGKFYAKFLLAMPNKILKDAGKEMAKDAQLQSQQQSQMEQQQVLMEGQREMLRVQAEMEKAKKAGVNISISGEDLATYPHLNAFVQNMGFGYSQQQQQPAVAPQGVQQPGGM